MCRHWFMDVPCVCFVFLEIYSLFLVRDSFISESSGKEVDSLLSNGCGDVSRAIDDIGASFAVTSTVDVLSVSLSIVTLRSSSNERKYADDDCSFLIQVSRITAPSSFPFFSRILFLFGKDL